MAYVAHCSLGACLGPKKKLNALPIFQSGNASHSSHLFTNQQKTISKFSQLLSLGGKEHQNVGKKSEEQWKIWCTDDEKYKIDTKGFILMNLVKEFCKAINEKNPQKLSQLLSQNFVFEDFNSYIPSGDKQAFVNYLQKAMDAMGPNFRVVTNTAEGENLIASVDWHLEWVHNDKAYEIPFTAGYNRFHCEQVNEKVLIRKITGAEEIPLKPVDLVLKLLKAVSTVFDKFPVATEGLLQKSQISNEGVAILLAMLGANKKHRS